MTIAIRSWPRADAWRLVVGLLPVFQPGAARYTAAGLECARFEEVVRSDIRSSAGSVVRNEQAGRSGFLVVRAARGDSGLALTMWYDSLAVYRDVPEGRIVPDTDGLVGGRWRGWLSGEGRFLPRALPFIPDEVAEAAELSHFAEDFFPLLPDSVLGSGARHHWSRQAEADSTTMVQDSIAVPVHRSTRESGSLIWDSRLGPRSWEREVRVTVRVPPGKLFPRGLVTEMTQQIRVSRMPASGECGSGL